MIIKDVLKKIKDIKFDENFSFQDQITTIKTAVTHNYEHNKVIAESYHDSAPSLTEIPLKQFASLEINNNAVSRIGRKVIKQSLPNKAGQEIAEGKRLGVVSIVGDAPQQTIKYLDSFRQGKNVKTFIQFMRMNVPLVRLSSKETFINRVSGYIDHSVEFNTFLLGDGGNNINGSLIYNDNLAGNVYTPERYIKAGEYILGYPIVTDNIVNFSNFQNPDAFDSFDGPVHKDAAIEVFEIRKQFANTNSADIVINGIKADFGAHHQQAGQWSDKKGSSIVDDKFEHLQGDSDWFEDAQDLAFREKAFSNNLKYFSFDGYISDGVYKYFPYRDKSFTDDYYNLLNNQQKHDLLKNSNKDISEIGTRYKSASTNYDVSSSKTKVVKNFFGKDSITFRNMDRS